MKTIALSTTAFFAFNPTNEVIRARYAKERKLDPKSLPTEPENEEMIAAFKQIKQDMIEEENNRPIFKRNVEGDASETGLVKFILPLLMKKYGG